MIDILFVLNDNVRKAVWLRVCSRVSRKSGKQFFLEPRNVHMPLTQTIFEKQ
jgi:hypothetical protein